MIENKDIKAIMCDVDGTLLNDEGLVSPKTIEAIRKVKEQGFLFGLATGRDVHSVKALLKEWGIDGLVDAIVGTGGAEVCDFTHNVEKASYPLDGELIKEIVAHYEDMDLNFAIPYNGKIFAPKDDDYIRMLSKFDKIPYEVVDFDEFLKVPRPKVMLVCNEEYMDTIIERSKSFSSDQYKSSSLKTASVLYEYMDPRISKTHGLLEIMELHGWNMDHLCCFGDADNDYDMVHNSGVGVVMGNGSELTKSAADYLTDDNNHDGIANFIHQYLLAS